MYTLQFLIALVIAIALLSLITVIGTVLQDNLVFNESYESRFTPHGLVIKAMDVLIILFLLAIFLTIMFKFDYIYNSSMASSLGSWNAQTILGMANLIQNIFEIVAEVCLLVWLVMMFIYTKPQAASKFIRNYFLEKGEK